ncbi:MAG: FecR domain-containing protein [Novosphingobium sp.]
MTEESLRLAAADWLVRLQEHPDDEALKDAFDDWLDADARHVIAWASIADTADAIADSDPTFRDRWDGASGVIPASHRARQGWRHHGRRKWAIVAVAAACAGILAAPSLLLHLRADHRTGAGEIRMLAMDDGSRIRLGPDSAIATSFDKGHRDVLLLSGQAWFEVRPDKARPFRVKARNVTTTVLGTGFDVRMIGAATSVAVRHGRVRVEAQGAPIRELTEGQWATATDGTPLKTGTEQPDLIGAWQSGDILVRRLPIAAAIDELRPWFNGRIIVTDASLSARPISGIYHANDPAKALETMVHPYGGRVNRITPWLLIVSGP